MSSDTFDVRIRSVQGRTVLFDVLTGTAGGLDDCCTSRSFALFLLHDALTRAPDSLPGDRDDAWRAKATALQTKHDASKLGKALAGESWYDAGWMRDNVGRFIAETALIERRNNLDYEVLSARECEIEAQFPNGLSMDQQHVWRPMRWERSHNYTLSVVATEPEWVEHLEVGVEFPTVGYDAWDESELA